jgi:large subunit ribosomal protein L18
MANKSRSEMRQYRHKRIRKRISGTAECPRLSVFKSLKQIYAQIIDDTAGHTICSASTVEPSIKSKGNISGAETVGEALAKRALEKGIKKVVFDRGGYRYHGSVAALAEASRKAGLEF